MEDADKRAIVAAVDAPSIVANGVLPSLLGWAGNLGNRFAREGNLDDVG